MFEFKIIDFKRPILDLLVIPVCQNTEIHSDETISRLVKTAKSMTGFEGKNGEKITLFNPSGVTAKRVLFIGLGNLEKIDSQRIRSIAGGAAKYCIEYNITAMIFLIPSIQEINTDNKELFVSVMEGIILGNYVFDIYKEEHKKNQLNKITFAVSDMDQLEFHNLVPKVEAICHGTLLARQWVNMPSNEKTPKQFARLILDSAEDNDISISLFDKKWLQDRKFGAMLAVAQGSINMPCLVTMEYKPTSPQRTILLVGKGVTFDSGGINLKPSAGLQGMKTDMAGAAAVAGTLTALAKLKINSRVVGVIPLVENMLSDRAMRPGDIIRSYFGKTIEIGNTDAEGRLILIDALAWGIYKYKPDIAIDIATLTGACAVALGEKIAGVFSNDIWLANSIIKAGEKTFERCWNMPIPNDYRELLKSDVADLSNISSSKWGGAITAALFLSEFVGKTHWAHIDIAGTARSKVKSDYCGAGSTGFGVRLLCKLLEDLDQS